MFEAYFNGTGNKHQVVSFDVGVGKSSLIKAFILFLRQERKLENQGIVIFLSRLEEVKSFIADCQLSGRDFAVISGNEDYNSMGLGHLRSDDAPVLFVVQQKLEAMAMKGLPSFAKDTRFHYKGMPRNLRLWDECFKAAEPITVRWDALAALPLRYRGRADALVNCIDQMAEEILWLPHGGPLLIPAGLKDVKLPYTAHDDDADRKLVRNLVGLAGTTARVVNDPQRGATICGAAFHLPADLAPLFVFDAAARVTTGYADREAHIGDVERIATIANDYRNVTAHCWEQGASRSTLRNDAARQRVITGIADLANSSAEPFLIVHPQAREEDGYDIEREVRRALEEPDRVSFLHFGNHHGTNAYRDIRNVVLIGIWHKPTASAVANYIVATGLQGDQFDDGDWDAMRIGELKETIMQAAGRANLRNVRYGVAGPCNVYIITAARDQATGLMKDVFPGAPVRTWLPIQKPLATVPGQIMEFLLISVLCLKN